MLPQENNVRKETVWSRLVAALIVLTVGGVLSACRHGAEVPQETSAEACAHEYRVVSTTATCTRRGVTVSVCDLCGETKEKYSNPLGHVFEDYVCQREGCGLSSIYYAADFGAVGDGVTDDGPAICNAVNAAKATQGKLIFESNKTYYIGTASAEMSDFKTPFSLLGCSDVVLDGNGATFLMAPHLTYLNLWGCSDVTIRNCNFDYSESVYLVGTVKSISGKTVTFSTDIEPYTDYYDYTGVTAFSVRYRSGVQDYSHGFLKTMTKTGSKEVTVTYSSSVGNYTVGKVVYLPNPGIGHVGSEAIYIGASKGTVTLENIEIRAARIFGFHINGNDGDIYLKNVDLTPGEENTRSIKMVAWRDGFHCKNNRGAIHWIDCENDVVFDDVMNVRGVLGCIKSVTDGTQFVALNYEHQKNLGQEVAFDCMAGDVLDFYDQDNDVYYGYAKVQAASVSGGTTIITLDTSYCTVDLTRVNLNTCRIGNRNTCAPGSTIRNCTFRGSFRFQRELTAENTTFYCLSMWILAEGGVEGPIPGNITFRSCTFRYGKMQIDGYNRWDTGRYMPNIGAQIQGIRAYDCTYLNGFKVTSSTGCYLEKYVNGVLQAGAPSAYVSRTDYKILSSSEMSAGHTFDFSAGNALKITGNPDISYAVIDQYTSLDKVASTAASAMRAGGFGESVFFYNKNCYLNSLTGSMEQGKKYELSMKVYDCAGNLTTSGARGAFVLLKMANGIQVESEVSYTCTVDPDNRQLVTLTFTFTVEQEATNDFDLYELTDCEFYIGSVTVREVA